MLAASPALAAVNSGYVASVVGFNVLGLLVTARLGPVSRAVLLSARTALVSVGPHVKLHVRLVCGEG